MHIQAIFYMFALPSSTLCYLPTKIGTKKNRNCEERRLSYTMKERWFMFARLYYWTPQCFAAWILNDINPLKIFFSWLPKDLSRSCFLHYFVMLRHYFCFPFRHILPQHPSKIFEGEAKGTREKARICGHKRY